MTDDELKAIEERDRARLQDVLLFPAIMNIDGNIMRDIDRLIAEVKRLWSRDGATLALLMALYHEARCNRPHDPMAECPRFDVWFAGSLPVDVDPWPDRHRTGG